jgi:hypothetical protein
LMDRAGWTPCPIEEIRLIFDFWWRPAVQGSSFISRLPNMCVRFLSLTFVSKKVGLIKCGSSRNFGKRQIWINTPKFYLNFCSPKFYLHKHSSIVVEMSLRNP